MLKIIYPSDPITYKSFCERYYNDIIKAGIIDENEVNKLLKKIPSSITLKDILISEFDQLILINDKCKSLTSPDLDLLKNQFVYEKKGQPVLARFFSMQEEVKIESCFFCNMNYIHSFKEYGEYVNGLDFLNNAHDYELLTVPYITHKKLDEVKSNRKYNSISKARLDKRTKKWLNNYDPKNIKNHFTLDHVLPKKEYRLLSLSLFNLVPCCFACNSKFKRSKEYKPVSNTKFASPSSKDFSIDKDFEFFLQYEGKLEDLNTSVDFQIRERIINNGLIVNQYFEMFKIPGRYLIHKPQVANLIEKMTNYSDSKISEIEELTEISKDQIKRDLYEDVIYNEKLEHSSLAKFKKDIAKDLKII